MLPSSSRFERSVAFRARCVLTPTCVALAIAGAAQAQVVAFGVDYRSPIIGPTAITAADVLVTAGGGIPAYGPLPPPLIMIPGGPIGVAGIGLMTYAACAGAPPGGPCPLEVDAISFGLDFPVRPGPLPAGTYVFSVDEFAVGRPGSPLAPNILSEAPFGDSSADVWAALGLPPAPLPPPPVAAPVPGHSGLYDGNGLPSPTGAVYPGFGLIEPDMPVPGPMIDGDDVDALDILDGPPLPPAPILYFSLDAAFFDPALGMPNTGSAAANGFLPGAILMSPGGGGPIGVYAMPPMLGLDLFGPPGSDDLDALALWENGIPGFQPGPGPFAWIGGGADMVLFSVRRGSAVIGVPDSLFGLPIQPGDILTLPMAPGLPPSIFIAAEWLGLATTRSNGVPFGGDDLDALDTRWAPQTGLSYCFGTPAACPCANGGAPGNGCANSVFAAGANLAATGVASVSADTVLLTGTTMPPGGTALYFQGTTQLSAIFGDGLRCVGGTVIRFPPKINTPAGSSAYPGPGDPSVSLAGLVPTGGATRFYQCWYRNAPAFCTAATFNLSNGLAVVWTP